MKIFTKLGNILTRKEQLQVFGLFSLMLIGAGLEALGIGIIMPYIAIINSPEIIQNNKTLNWFYNELNISSYQSFIIWSGISLMFLYVIKNVFLSFLFYIQYRFVFTKQASLSARLLEVYLNNPYTFHLQRNTAELLRNINTEVASIFHYIVIPILIITSEAMVIGLILSILLFEAFWPTLMAVGALGGFTYIFYRPFHKKLKRLGEKYQYHNGLLIKWVQQSLASIKEVKILGRESFFINAYGKNSLLSSRALSFLHTTNQLPKLFIETITVISVIAVVVILLSQGKTILSLLPTLALFAMASFRLMPSLNRIVSSVTTARYYNVALDVIHKDLISPEGDRHITNSKVAQNKQKIEIKFNKEIKLNNIVYKYPGSTEPSLKQICLSIPKGYSVAFTGPSGSGKTTLINIILGLLKPTEGQLMIDGLDIQSNLESWQSKIGFIPQPVYLLDDTIRRNIAFGLNDDMINDDKIFDSLKLAKLDDFVKSLPEKLDSRVGEHGIRISGGQRQRIGIARALYYDPEILVLDEATSELDAQTENEITRTIEQLTGKKTIIIIAHRPSTIEKCNVIFDIFDGRIIKEIQPTIKIYETKHLNLIS